MFFLKVGLLYGALSLENADHSGLLVTVVTSVVFSIIAFLKGDSLGCLLLSLVPPRARAASYRHRRTSSWKELNHQDHPNLPHSHHHLTFHDCFYHHHNYIFQTENGMKGRLSSSSKS